MTTEVTTKLYPIDGFTPELRFMQSYEAQTARAPVAEQVVTEGRKYSPRSVPLRGGALPQRDHAASRRPVFVNPYSTPDQLVAPPGIEPIASGLATASDKGDTSENLRRPAKTYTKPPGQVQINNRHSSLLNRQGKFRNSPFNQAFRASLTALNGLTLSPTNNPTRKQMVTAYTPPLQRFRVINTWQTVGASQSANGKKQSQPSVVIPGPQHSIDTRMPWNPIGN